MQPELLWFQLQTLTSRFTTHYLKHSVTSMKVQCIIHGRCANCIQILFERALKTATRRILTQMNQLRGLEL